MSGFSKIFKSNKWTLVHLWFLCLFLIITAIIMRQFKIDEQASITIIFSSLLLNAVVSSIYNAINKKMVKNLIKSVPAVLVHAIICFILIKSMKPDHGEALMNVYITILIFYFMLTVLSVMFKAVYISMSQK